MLVDVHGKPLTTDKSQAVNPAALKNLVEHVNTYLLSVGGISGSAEFKSRDPFGNHVWVYAAAMVTALTASSAPFTVMREKQTSNTLTSRVRCGNNRRAYEKHLRKSASARLFQKTAEPDYDHPIYALLRSPNPFQSGAALFQFTYLWLAIRGEVFWLYTDEDGRPTDYENAKQIWPFSPDAFRPALSAGSRGTLIGWWFTPPAASPMGENSSSRIAISLTELSHFKFANPNSHFRGMSRLSAAALSIDTSLLAKQHNRSLLANGAVPKGVITYPGTLEEKAETEFRKMWKEQHEGPNASGTTAMLHGGFNYQVTQLSPADMEYVQQDDVSRREILAAMGVPPSIVGLTETTNYATAQVQENGFWTRTILPTMHVVETELDRTLFFTESDDVFGMHDVSSIDALRVGLNDKVTLAKSMCEGTLHMPPRVAYQVVGLEIPEYKGDDKAFITGIVSTVDETLAADQPEQVTPPEDAGSNGGSPAPADANQQPGEPAASLLKSREHRIAKARGRHREFLRLVKKLEGNFKSGYRGWVAQERAQTLARFDRNVKDASLNIDAVLPSQDKSSDKLKSKTEKARKKQLKAAFDFTSDELSTTPTFSITDEKFQTYFRRRAAAFGDDVSKTVIRKLKNALKNGLAEGETIQELRMRVAHVYDISASSAKALSIARTETANMVNGVRDQVFDEAGITEEEWVDSGDDEVRDSHKVFGSAGPKKRGFNYMSLVSGDGLLRHPGDLEGPPDQVISCRCVKIPVG